jgi:DNA-binding transcriptional LysR family regulator
MNFKGLDLNLLVALDALLSERSTTRAGEKIHLSQSAVSGALARLRHFFSDDLLVPVGNKMVLTPLAEELSRPVREALSAIDTVVKKDAVFDPTTANRRFRIMLSDYAAMVLMTQALPRLQSQAPGITFELVSNSEFPAHAIERDEVDLLLIAKQFTSANEPSEDLFSDDYSCVVWTGNRSCGEAITMEEYLRLGHVVARFGRAQQMSADELFLIQTGIHRRVELVVMSFNMLPQMVVNTERIATVHSRLARLYAQWLPLRILPTPIAIPRLVEVMCWNRLRERDRGIQWLREALKEAVADGPPVAARSVRKNGNRARKTR